MHIITQTITDFLNLAAEGKAPFSEKLLLECVEDIKEKILQTFHDTPQTEFRLRMSNIGKDLRQLMLEKEYGRAKASPEFLLKMLTGHIQERILTYICKSQGLDIKTDDVVCVNIAGTDIEGELDWYLTIDGKVYDVKTASPYAYDTKFASFESLSSDDTFGYIDQLIGYAQGKNAQPGGWVVFQKVTGQYKVVEYPYSLEQSLPQWEMRVKRKIHALESGSIPPCQGLEQETFYQKPTGRTIIGKKCQYCDHKQKCHPNAKLLPSKCSNAKNKPLVWYIE